MLMVTSSVGMLHGVHAHTTHLGPGVPLHLVLVVGSTGLQQGLVYPASARHDACQQRERRAVSVKAMYVVGSLTYITILFQTKANFPRTQDSQSRTS